MSTFTVPVLYTLRLFTIFLHASVMFHNQITSVYLASVDFWNHQLFHSFAVRATSKKAEVLYGFLNIPLVGDFNRRAISGTVFLLAPAVGRRVEVMVHHSAVSASYFILYLMSKIRGILSTWQMSHWNLTLYIPSKLHTFKGTHARDFHCLFLNFFLHLSVTNRYQTQYSQHFRKYSSNSPRYSKFSITRRFRRKHEAWLSVVAENAELNLALSS